MEHLIRFIADMLLDLQDTYQHIRNLFNQNKPEPSLIVHNVYWCTYSTWMDRLIAYKHLDNWTCNK